MFPTQALLNNTRLLIYFYPLGV
uniref:Uncharacterized protein n=1 Tax=Anguilla anguilla TaxID=7936 RepID=A0A0E9SF87_ANGAN